MGQEQWWQPFTAQILFCWEKWLWGLERICSEPRYRERYCLQVSRPGGGSDGRAGSEREHRSCHIGPRSSNCYWLLLLLLVLGPLLLLVIVIGVIVIGPRSVTVIGCLLQIILQAAMRKSTRKKSALDSFGSYYSPEAFLNWEFGAKTDKQYISAWETLLVVEAVASIGIWLTLALMHPPTVTVAIFDKSNS